MAKKTAFDSWREETLQDVWDFMYVVDWSCAELARNAGVASTTVYNLRNLKTREPRASTIFKIAKSLGLSMSVMEQKASKPKLLKGSRKSA
jgi:transcriptional regulator with XRE-family HTH domain